MSRIANLSKRNWESEVDENLITELSNLLRTPHGTQRLRPCQAGSLFELYEYSGAFGALSAGEGKTLISALAPVVWKSERPLVVVPAKLVRKTMDEFEELRRHWKIPFIPVVSYTFLSQEKNANYLFQYRPDALIFDEAHALKTAGRIKDAAGVAIRVRRYLAQFPRPKTKVLYLTGTINKDSILDYAFALVWCLGEFAPVPLEQEFQELWAACLDVRKPGLEFSRPSFSPLVKDLGACPTLEAAREAYAERLRLSPGVLISTGLYRESRLIIEPVVPPPLEGLDEYWTKLRGQYLAPDDWPLGDQGAQVWSTARSLSRGYYRYHVPWPPEEWMLARRAWTGYVHRVIQAEGSRWDTEHQVALACESGELVSRAYQDWVQIRPTHEYHRETRWLSREMVEFVKRDVVRKFGHHGGIVWTDQVSFAQALAKATGWTYYGQLGLDASGRPIEKANPKDIIIASVAANGTGRNLQKWHLNYFACPPPTNQTNEQALARTHRPGQTQPEVRAWYLFTCAEDISTFNMALAEAKFSYQTTKQEFRLLEADLTLPDPGRGSAFEKQKKQTVGELIWE